MPKRLVPPGTVVRATTSPEGERSSVDEYDLTPSHFVGVRRGSKYVPFTRPSAPRKKMLTPPGTVLMVVTGPLGRAAVASANVGWNTAGVRPGSKYVLRTTPSAPV